MGAATLRSSKCPCMTDRIDATVRKRTPIRSTFLERYRSGHTGADSKSVGGVSPTWVRIPPSPPEYKNGPCARFCILGTGMDLVRPTRRLTNLRGADLDARSAKVRVHTRGGYFGRRFGTRTLRRSELWFTLARSIFRQISSTGEVAERLKAHAWKVCIRLRVSGVRIPPSPP